ncbi:expressed unknown protein [Ectocarpus siliculosus]|uniref:Uncharacterized protein n=1 Tax=Ectocarpus siliculosus TaxID=2880 RepID=D7FJZ7_ECTSI|nr:expressed unknown protein [Ectocarpus siliculosus]|eukprot:CBJ49086.1 expressed unknown protein [Ectocarpus siliculosus]
MDCLPELVVAKRKTISSAKMAKRLRRFVGENQRPDAPEGGDGDVGDDDVQTATKPAASGELLCRIPEETLFQLQQIYEALEGASGVKPASSAPSLTDLIAASAGDGGEAEPMSGGTEASVVTPEKTTKQKRVRGGEEPATASKASGGSSIGTSPKIKKKKSRRKSNAT